MNLALVLAVAALLAAENIADAKDPVLPDGLTLLEKQDEFLVVLGPEGQGVCSPSGVVVIPARFDQINYVGDHLFAVAKFRDDGSTARWLFNAHGKVVAKLPEWARVDQRRFSEGLLSIGEEYSLVAFINKQGKLLPNFDLYTDVKEFSCGLAAATLSDRRGRWSGFINHQGKMVIGPYKDRDLSNFENGVAVVNEYVDKKYRSGLVSTSGKFVMPMKFGSISSIGNGKFWVTHSGHIQFFDSAGKLFIDFPRDCTSASPPDKFEKNTWIACGFGGTLNNSLKWGYCDMHGKVVMSPRFPVCFSFIGNRAVACAKLHDNLACGVIDRKGNWLVKPKYQGVVIVDDSHWKLDNEIPADGKFVNAGSFRDVVFEKLLRDNDLIGMTFGELEKVLGKLDSPAYLEQKSKIGVKVVMFNLNPGAMCGSGSRTLLFAFDQSDKVTGWRIMGGGYEAGSQPWITENVVAENESKGLVLGNLIPKR